MTIAKVVEALKEEVARLNKAIQLIEGANQLSSTPSKPRRSMSPEAIERIRASQKKRWAAIKKKAPTPKKGS